MSLTDRQKALWEVFKPKPSPKLKGGELKAFNNVVGKITVIPLENDLIQISYEKLSKEDHLIIAPSWGLLNIPDEVIRKIKILDDRNVVGRINLKPLQQVNFIEEERKNLLRNRVFEPGRNVGSRNIKTEARNEKLAKLIASRLNEKNEALFSDPKVKEVIGKMSLSNFSKILKIFRDSKK